jgi:hypothetical protein
MPTHRPARRRDLFARWAGHICRVGLAVGVVGFVGCRQIGKVVGKNDKQELLEAELRTRERELLDLRAENQHLRQLAEIYQRQGYAGVHAVVPGPVVELTGTSHAAGGSPLVRELTLGTGTGGRDDDGHPGDETLQVVIVPKDDDGTAVKVPGRATVSALDITREGVKVPIGKWEVTPEQLKKTWRGGFLSSGYFVPLQWDQAPTGERVRVTVRFTTTDGRLYEADKDVQVKPLPGLPPRGGFGAPAPTGQPGAMAPVMQNQPMPPPDSTLLPIPRTVEPAPATLQPAVAK